MERHDIERLARMEVTLGVIDKRTEKTDTTLSAHIGTINTRVGRLEKKWAWAAGIGTAIGTGFTLAFEALFRR